MNLSILLNAFSYRIQLKRVKQIDEGSMDQVTENQLLFQGETWEKLKIHQKVQQWWSRRPLAKNFNEIKI